ncbi:ABC transporter ATP-binding protein [Microbispora sp. ATCC PTA-5024]|uniref:ABC transporter ATP-binding protein n=1 Tax=Microbispora sp. ATCC PTA-5024 TaxID=316330 RepID=UPI0001AB3C16|nr:ABC transporter ATP-binding protein [Microbispora sp. ATCC PTA-5024]ETK34057.1 ABC transporter ATP-binding domain [Microbispora sp. ATCC PTA-5024]
MTVPAFELSDLTVRYGPVTAVDGVSAGSAPGLVTALLGPNGAGKSSLLRVLSTVAPPSSGTARVFGHDTRAEPLAARRRIGLVFQERALDTDLSAEQNLRFHARLFGVGRARAAEDILVLLERFGLAGRGRDRVETLSGGLARRLEIARALLHRPGLLILDEPTNGLDPEARQTVWDDLIRLRSELGVTVLYSTHYMDEAELADQIIILSEGRVAGFGSPGRLKSELRSSRIVLVTHDDDTVLARLAEAGFDAVIDSDGVAVRCREPESRMAEVIRAAGPLVRAASVHHPSMNDVFLAHTAANRDREAADGTVSCP